MNPQTKHREADETEKDMLRIKKLPMRLAVGDDHLENKIKRAFELAKSSGHELDLTFITQAA
jgi:hypothetical protein